MRFRYGTRALFLAVVVVAAFFPFQRFYDDWFRSSYSGYHVHKSLGEYVSDGNSFDYVSSLFDRSEPRKKQWIEEYVLPNQKSIFANYEDGDEYHLFFIDGGKLRALFQFRDGLVVNHVNSQYRYPYSSIKHPNDYSPSLMFRLGALPLYVLIVTVFWVIAWIAWIAWHLATNRKPDAG